jgi:glycosyltransferase involved in cell wall biosynthesis
VVIPTYNRAELLRATLKSVLDQTVPAAEIIVVDDGSTDDTERVAQEATADGAPMVYLKGPHRNRLGESRNRGVDASKGAWVAFLDSDDLWLPRRLELQLDALAAAPEAGFAFCNLQRFDENGPYGGGPYLPPSADYNGYILGDLLQEPVAVPSALMVKRSAFYEAGGLADRPINEDYELTLKLAARYLACYVGEPLVLMRRHPASRSRVRSEMAHLEFIRIVATFLDEHPGLPTQTRARGRMGLANVHFKLARHYMDDGKRAAARKHIRAMLRLRPLDRRALPAYLKSWWPGVASPASA